MYQEQQAITPHAFRWITIPIIFPTVVAAVALVLLDRMKMLTTTLGLSPKGMHTLATEVHTANLESVAVAPHAALLIVVSVLPVYLLTTRLYLNKA